MTARIARTAIAGLSLLTTSFSPVYAQEVDAAAISRKANEAQRQLGEGDVDGALATYKDLDESSLTLAAIYNHAVALYRNSEYESAADRFQRVASSSENSLVAKARFNLGNCHYALAIKSLDAVEPETESATEHLSAAINHFRAALRLDPSDTDARINIELAAKLLDQVRQEQEQPNQRQSQQQENTEQGQTQDDSEKSSENDQRSDEQPSESPQQDSYENGSSNQSNTGEQDSERNESSQESEPQDSEDNKNGGQTEDSADSDASEPESNEEPDSSSDPASSDNGASNQQGSESESAENASEADQQESDRASTDLNRSRQQSPTDQSEDGGMDSEPEAPNDPSQQPDTSDGKLEASNQEGAAERDEKMTAIESDANAAMTQEEAGKMLQAIRDRDMIRRLRREAAKRNRYIPVDRDW